MALVRVDEGWKRGGASIEGRPGIEPIRVANSRIYTVQYDTVDPLNLQAALFASKDGTSIPPVGSFWGTDAPYLTCTRVRVLDPLGPFLFHVLAEYTGRDSPLAQAPILREGGRRLELPCSYDATGKPYRNTVGQRITGCTRPFPVRLFYLTRNEATDMFVGGDWRYKVNSATLNFGSWSFAPRTVLIEEISAPREPGPNPLIGAASTITSITLAGGVYTVHVVSGVGFLNGAVISCGDGTNSIQGAIASGGETANLVLATSGLVVHGDPTAIAGGTAVGWVAMGIGINYYWPVTYTLAVLDNVQAFNGGSPANYGWQRVEPNHGSRYREASGGALRATAKYLGVPDVLLHQDGTVVADTEPDSSLYWLTFNDYLPVDFAALAFGT